MIKKNIIVVVVVALVVVVVILKIMLTTLYCVILCQKLCLAPFCIVSLTFTTILRYKYHHDGQTEAHRVCAASKCWSWSRQPAVIIFGFHSCFGYLPALRSCTIKTYVLIIGILISKMVPKTNILKQWSPIFLTPEIGSPMKI